MNAPIVEGHVIATTLAGRATLTVHAYAGPSCVPLLTVLLEPSQMLDLATQLTEAAIPQPPVVRRRMTVRQDRDWSQLWGYNCPECLPIVSRWVSHADALRAANRHLEVDHASEREAAR